MTANDRRVRAATLLRELGHDFVARDVTDDVLDELIENVQSVLDRVRAAPLRERAIPHGALLQFKMAVPVEGRVERHQLFADSVVSGSANPMGLGADLWREGEVAVMEVTLGKAFEGAPGRSHGGIVAALIDETMGLVLSLYGELAFTVQLDISYLAPTPINQPITARAWLEERDGRKLSIRASVQSIDAVVAEASALFIAVDPKQFLGHHLETDERSHA